MPGIHEPLTDALLDPATYAGDLHAALTADPLLCASANRDRAEFGPTSGTFDVGRSPNHPVTLAHGPHVCLGAAVARLELTVVREGVAARWARLEVAGPVVRSGSSIIAGIRSAPRTLEAR